MSPGTPPPPTFKRHDDDFANGTTRNNAPVPQSQTNPNPPANPAAQLQAKGGRTFNSGTLWVARMGKQQEVGKTEGEAAGKLLARLA